MSVFRKPKTQNERKADQAARQASVEEQLPISGRQRTRSKEAASLPTSRSDKMPAANKDRSRGKASHSPSRKAKSKARDRSFSS